MVFSFCKKMQIINMLFIIIQLGVFVSGTFALLFAFDNWMAKKYGFGKRKIFDMQAVKFSFLLSAIFVVGKEIFIFFF